MSSAKKDSFTSSFPVCMLFISSSCLIAVPRTATTMLNEKGESEHPCLVPHLQSNTCSSCPLSTMLTVGLSYMAFIMFQSVLSISTLLRVFIINGCWILSNVFMHLVILSCDFYLSFLFMWCITFIDL